MKVLAYLSPKYTIFSVRQKVLYVLFVFGLKLKAIVYNVFFLNFFCRHQGPDLDGLRAASGIHTTT